MNFCAFDPDYLFTTISAMTVLVLVPQSVMLQCNSPSGDGHSALSSLHSSQWAGFPSLPEAQVYWELSRAAVDDARETWPAQCRGSATCTGDQQNSEQLCHKRRDQLLTM